MDERGVTRLLGDEGKRRQAFAEVVETYKERLYWQVRRMVVNHDDADDVLQNTFMKAWMALDSFRGEAKLSTWLYRIAWNETLNFLTRERHTAASLDDTEGGLAQRLEGDPYFDGDETMRQLQEAIASLPPRQRQVFTLKYFDDMKYEDMSAALGTSVGALKASYHHAVKKIAEYFEAKS